MLAGEKKLAMFCDLLVPGVAIAEEIIPEKKFAPHVKAHRITRWEEIIYSAKVEKNIKFVFFTLPDEEWRAHTIVWIKRETYAHRRPYDKTDDIVIGRLLGYSEEEIATFTNK